MKNIVLSCVCVCAIGAYAQVAIPKFRDDPELEAARAMRAEKVGGLVTKAPSGKEILIVDRQSAVKLDDWKDFYELMKHVVHAPASYVKVDKPEGCPLAAASEALKMKNAGVAILVVEDDKLPSLTIAPETGWAVVNVKAVGSDGAKGQALAQRVKKEVWRAAAYLLGAADTTQKGCIMNYIRESKDLDLLGVTPSMGPIQKMIMGASQRGIDLGKRRTYKNACKEGWAPPPTNDIQRVIWNEFHEKPSKPLKIKYDPKNGK